ncbi:MAG: EscU/YscU/HrcU family type III secretion system export apparatus switch protein [Clostridiales bacterium]|jgi:flagellar biosynthesis protein|nr:EscU/YscU/HrcU family type III secretion system export apparatus switch protein [Clostridiales bacterium]
MDNLKKPYYQRQKAVAIRYDPDEIAPKILAKGAGVIAEKILENAADIPIHKDAALVDDLTRLDLGEHIPPELYEAVAKILVFISELDRKEEERRWQER